VTTLTYAARPACPQASSSKNEACQFSYVAMYVSEHWVHAGRIAHTVEAVQSSEPGRTDAASLQTVTVLWAVDTGTQLTGLLTLCSSPTLVTLTPTRLVVTVARAQRRTHACSDTHPHTLCSMMIMWVDIFRMLRLRQPSRHVCWATNRHNRSKGLNYCGVLTFSSQMHCADKNAWDKIQKKEIIKFLLQQSWPWTTVQNFIPIK